MPAGSPPLRLSAAGIDLSPRVQRTGTVAASPALSAETIIASLTLAGDLIIPSGVYLFGFAAYTIGASGVSCNLKIRKTDASGSTLKATGAVTIAAAALGSGFLVGFDSSPTVPGQVYVLTMTVASGAAESTVSAVELVALAV